MNWFEYKSQVDAVHAPDALKQRLLAMQEDADPTDSPKMRTMARITGKVHRKHLKHWKGIAIAACCTVAVLVGTQLYPYGNDFVNYSAAQDSFQLPPNTMESIAEDSNTAGGASQSEGSSTPSNLQDRQLREGPRQRMIVYTTYLSLEATNYDETRAALDSAIETVEGYVSQLDESTQSTNKRDLNCTYRVPAQYYTEFLDLIAESGNLVHSNETSEDITSQYIDVEARVNALTAQRDQLITLQSQATELSDLLAIQDQLTQVQSDLESWQQQLQYYADQAEYCTVHVSLREVDAYTSTDSSLLAKISTAFTSAVKDFGNILLSIVLGTVHLWPWIVIVVIVIIWRRKKH